MCVCVSFLCPAVSTLFLIYSVQARELGALGNGCDCQHHGHRQGDSHHIHYPGTRGNEPGLAELVSSIAKLYS